MKVIGYTLLAIIVGFALLVIISKLYFKHQISSGKMTEEQLKKMMEEQKKKNKNKKKRSSIIFWLQIKK